MSYNFTITITRIYFETCKVRNDNLNPVYRPTDHKGKSQRVLKGHSGMESPYFEVYLQSNHRPPLACHGTPEEPTDNIILCKQINHCNFSEGIVLYFKV